MILILNPKVTLGKRSSDILCRFYDKRAQEKEFYQEMGKELPEHWIRCELEMHRERALNFATLYIDPANEKPLGELFAEVLNNCVTPSIFMLFVASYGDLDFLYELVSEGKKRATKKHMMMIEEFMNRAG